MTIDDQEQVQALIDKMAEYLPISAEIPKRQARYLRAQGLAIPPHRQIKIYHLFNSGDQGGIMCGISPSDSEEAIVISLTHLKIPCHHPLTKEIRTYQSEREKKLRQQS
jgi:hypothetical protein